ncbi:hypothetical protein EG68_07797 [Paragonimus skrjabini miyazakii]|uniref:DNA-directed RNA polymerase III subunit RPC4 n=1 Tax=Paragonimus skrjabini miyazakii TaxID=59628 RepID=A0A8S9YQY8_9TREM|nr:hypothetical protein EG68_07797 [Paragonimus skrjabini miyazakii]
MDSAIARIESAESGAKRKFVPNLKNALNKQIKNAEKPAKAPRKDSRSDALTNNRPTRFERGGSQRATGHDGGPQFVQSYSIFETGIGCVVKPDKSSVELREERPSASKKHTDVQELSETELKDDPLSRYETFITDIKQVFKDPPILMQDSAASTHAPVDPLKDLDLSAGRNHRVPYDFFTDCGPGRLFSLRLPDKLLPSDLEQLKEGPFGKIQVLDNQQVRLVIGEAVFDLISPHPLTFSSDVVLLDPHGDEFIRLNCLGHLEQAMVAVPNLDEFVRLGQ